MKTYRIIYALIFVILHHCRDGNPAKYMIHNFVDCNPPNSINNVYVDSKVMDDDLYLQLNFSMLEDCRNDNYMMIHIDKIVGEKATRLVNLKHGGVCSALTAFGGQVYADIAQAIRPQIDNKVCPIPKEFYVLDWYHIDETKMPVLRFVPKGKFYIKIEEFKLDNVVKIFCGELVFERF